MLYPFLLSPRVSLLCTRKSRNLLSHTEISKIWSIRVAWYRRWWERNSIYSEKMASHFDEKLDKFCSVSGGASKKV